MTLSVDINDVSCIPIQGIECPVWWDVNGLGITSVYINYHYIGYETHR